MFYGDVETVIPEPKVIERSAGGIQSLKQASKLLAEAKRPVIVSGEIWFEKHLSQLWNMDEFQKNNLFILWHLEKDNKVEFYKQQFLTVS